MTHFFYLTTQLCTHASIIVYFMRLLTPTCRCKHIQSGPQALATSLACTSLWDSQASGSMYDRTSQKHCNNKTNFTPYKLMESS